MKAHLTHLIICAAALALPSTIPAQVDDPALIGWRTQIVDSVHNPYELIPSPSLAFNNAGLPILAYADYGNSRMKLATWNGSAWGYETIGSNYGSVSLAMDGNGKPTFAWTYANLFFSAKPASKWSTVTVDRSTIETYVPPSLVYDRTGNPAITYCVRNNGVEAVGLARRAGSTWTTTLIDARPAGNYYTSKFSSLAVDPTDGTPAVAYLDDATDDFGLDTLKFARSTPGGWAIETIDLGVSDFHGSVELDYVGGRPIIAVSADNSVLLLRKLADNSWSEQLVDAATNCDLCVKGDKAYLAYVTGGKLKIARATLPAVASDPAGWAIQVIDPDVIAENKPSIRLGPGDVPHVGYSVRGQLRLAMEDPAYPGPSILFLDDAESGVQTWIPEGDRWDSTSKAKPPGPNDPVDGNLWHQTTRRRADSGHSQETSWYYGIDAQGNYNTGSRNWGRLVSRGISIPAGARAELKVSQLIAVEGGSYENADIQVRLLPSGSWTSLLKRASRSTEFVAESVDLTPYLGKTIQIGFFLDTRDNTANQYEGWYVDDVTVTWWP